MVIETAYLLEAAVRTTLSDWHGVAFSDQEEDEFHAPSDTESHVSAAEENATSNTSGAINSMGKGDFRLGSIIVPIMPQAL